MTEQAAFDFCYGENSELKTVPTLTQPVILRLLRLHITWLKDAITHTQALWLFTLLTYLDPVMTAEHTSILRQVARHCIDLRQRIHQDEADQLARLNIIITIISRVFGQADLN